MKTFSSALQIVLNDAAQIQATLQSFTSVLTEMSQVYDTTVLQEQLDEASLQVSAVQDSFSAPLHQLEHAAAVSLPSCTPSSLSCFEVTFHGVLLLTSLQEAEAIEREVRQMENEVADIKMLLTSPETFPSPRESRLKVKP